MSGIHMMLLGAGGRAVITGSGTIVILTSYQYFYGYDNATGGAAGIFGAINDSSFNGATIKAVYSRSNPGSIGVEEGNAIAYGIIFNGNRAAGFFNTLRVNGTLVSGTLGAPSYSSGVDETTFEITLAASAATLFGTTDGVNIPIVIT